MEFFGEQLDGHVHIFRAVQWRFKVETLDVSAHVAGVKGQDDTVPHELCGGEVGRPCGELVRVVNEAAVNLDADAVWIVFLCAVVDNNVDVCDPSILWYLLDLFEGKKFHCVCAFDVDFISVVVTLCNVA